MDRIIRESMLKKGVLIIGLAFGWIISPAQEISREVLVPLATVTTAGSYDVSLTVGEPVVRLIDADKWVLTQGFQQPSYNLPLRPPPQGNGVNVFPNPVINNLKVEMFGETGVEYDITIFGLDGSVYFTERYECSGKFWRIETLDVSKFKRGLYFVRVHTSNNKIARMFKIEKM